MSNLKANTKLYIDGHIHFYENFSPDGKVKFGGGRISKMITGFCVECNKS